MAPPLIAFDFDGTLTGDEMVVELAAEAGVREEVSAISERAMRGEVDYATSLRERVSKLDGLELPAVVRAFDRIELREDAADTIATCRAAGTTVAVITGAFRRGVERALAAGGVTADIVIANELVTVDGRLNGVVQGPLVDGTKDVALARCAEQVGCTPAEAVAVGDGANDIPMLRAAGTAIGVRPKPGVAEVCDHEVDTLRAVLPLAGVTR